LRPFTSSSGGEQAAEAHLALVGHEPLDGEAEIVAAVHVAGEVELPREDVGDVPGQPLALRPPEDVVRDAAVERLVERVVDRALGADELRMPADGLGAGVPARC
jgi:hypothetical protein